MGVFAATALLLTACFVRELLLIVPSLFASFPPFLRSIILNGEGINEHAVMNTV
jgi:hypothetical protein